MRADTSDAEDKPGDDGDEQKKPGIVFGVFLHATPLGRGRSRVLFNVGGSLLLGMIFDRQGRQDRKGSFPESERLS